MSIEIKEGVAKDENGVFVQGSVAHDAVEAGNPMSTSGFATEDFGNEADVATGDRVRNLATRKGAQFVVVWAKVVDAADGRSNENILPTGISETDGAPRNTVESLLMGLAPDGAWDRLKGLGDTALLGLGQLAAAPWVPGASTVKSKTLVVGATSVNRAEVVAPAAGKKVRILSVKVANKSTTSPDKIGVYFGTGAAYLTNPTTVIGEYITGADGSDGESWPDGGGPIGAADAVVSWITETETEVGLDITIQYREE